jgi:hypothetical protein
MEHRLTQILRAASGDIEDSGAALTGDTSIAVGNDTTTFVVNANGGAANVASVAVTAAALKSIGLLSTVPCVVTLTGTTVIDGISTSTVTLAANTLRQVKAVTGDITNISVGPNTTGAGPAGTIKIRVLYNA